MEEICIREGGLFGWVDYLVLAVVLVGSCLIGTFYACSGPKQTTSADFLLGGSSMGTIPTALSLAAGPALINLGELSFIYATQEMPMSISFTFFITAIELLGNPSEMYTHGTQFWMICLSFILVVPITSYFYLPVFVNLKLTSSYEYLERRFNRHSRVLAATMYLLQMILYTSVAVYAPALALGHVTGLNTYLAVTVVYIICIFYASQGGMKAVIMTDTFQAIVLVASIFAVMLIGNQYLGGFSKIFKANLESHRIEFFIMDPNPTVRLSFWSVVIGGTFYWATMFCANQSSIQKYLSVETIGQARRAIWTSCVGLIIVFSINFYTGMILYDQYQDCDPLHNQEIFSSDELLPLYVMNIQGHLKGIPGLFVSGIFAASLGTVASAMNSLAAVFMKDILDSLCGIIVPDEKGAIVSKWLSLCFGLLSFALVFVVEQLGSVLEVALSFNGITGGITLGLFSLGMLFPWANSKGALTGGLVSLLLVSWIGIGAQINTALGQNYSDQKIISTDGCPCNSTNIPLEEIPDELPFWLYRISYLWYSAIGCLLTFFVGAIVSILTGPTKPFNVDSELISPPVSYILDRMPNKYKEKLNISLNEKNPKSKSSSKEGIVNQGLSLEPEIHVRL